MTSGTDSPFIVRSERLAALRTAETILAEARAEAERMLSAAQMEAVALSEAACAAGRASGMGDVAALLSAAAAAADLHLLERRDELREVAFAVAHRILSAMPRDAVVLQLATDAIAEHGRDARISVRVCQDAADDLRAALSATAHGERVSVAADPSLGPGDCVLLHPRGRTAVGLLAQFRAMLASSTRGEAERDSG